MEFNNEHSLKMGMFSEFEQNSLDIAMPSTDNTKEVKKELKQINRINNKSDKETSSNHYIDSKKELLQSEDYMNLIKRLPLLINEIVEDLIKKEKITKKTKQDKIESRVLTELGNRLRQEGIKTDIAPETLGGIRTLLDIKIKSEFDMLNNKDII